MGRRESVGRWEGGNKNLKNYSFGGMWGGEKKDTEKVFSKKYTNLSITILNPSALFLYFDGLLHSETHGFKILDKEKIPPNFLEH